MPKMVLTVPPEADGRRVDRFLADMLPERSRTVWQREVKAHQVKVQHRTAKSGDLVHVGDLVEVQWEDPPVARLDLDAVTEIDSSLIVYQDDAIVVVNKPRELVVHPSRGHWEDSVVHRLRPLLGDDGIYFRPGVVHRLDQNTTGLLVLARNELTRSKLSQAIAERKVHRRYLAVVHGQITPLTGKIDAPIGRDAKNRLKMATVLMGKPAMTRYRTIALTAGYSLVQLSLDTGRTHQIRVHLSAIGHAVVGDELYGGGHPQGLLGGQALHAGQLAFSHPENGNPLCFTAPLPCDWKGMGVLPWRAIQQSVFEDEEDLLYPCQNWATDDLLHTWASHFMGS
ncbi:MAG: RluA family pseudouridine synthase [Sulfobacillus benefaciens]|uniref:Pseudouridine synthase n=1 Tax=Sulfobacillus benefaciens TaxID=453960 RepID=A0A2T2XFG9_9FIRM|nr:MAG: RluA family pseudouridine synthase [Sulfobacillus benefaciens]